MTATLAAPRDAELVTSYWRLGRKLWEAGTAPHGPRHDCLPCSQLRETLGMDPLPIVIGTHVIETLPRVVPVAVGGGGGVG